MDLPMRKSEQLREANNFLKDFIVGEKYLQNPPMTTDKFIDFCKSLGVQTSKDELEYFEKEKLLFPIIRIKRPVGEEERIKFKKDDGKEYWRPAKNGLQEGETEVERYKVKFYSSYGFSEHNRDLLLAWTEEGNLFDPVTKEFQNWNTFLGEELGHDKQKIVSFYSGFQIYWLEILKKSFSITLNLAGDEIKVSSPIVIIDSREGQGSFSLAKIDDFAARVKEVAKKEPFEEFFDMGKKKEKLKEDCKKFDKFLKFLLSVQSIYFPYAKSGGGTIQIRGDDKKWYAAKLNFKLELVLNKIGLQIEDIVKWYKIFSDKAQNLLGIKRDDWVQLWKNIAWNEKDKLEGNVRLGVEYLQWAVMLKRVIEEHLQRDILDIDEMSNISADGILKFNPQQMNQCGVFLRATRNKRYSDNEKSYYHDRYKRLFYLANDFGLDYQPRVVVFVEGKTEETVFPEIFEWCKGDKSENIGVEFISIEGISQFFGQKIVIKNSSNKYQKGFISNLNHLISYNLNKWQIIPFFVGDNESNINYILQNGVSVSFNQKQYPFPKNWQFIWGVTNGNNSFRGKDFEMSNFNDEEIAGVLSVILSKTIKPSDVQVKRNQDQGIKQIDKGSDDCKIYIARKLIGNLFNQCEQAKENSLLERPIFKVIDKITNLAVLNHPPVDRQIELENRKYIENELKKNLSPSSETLNNSP